jgi:hypothetical protein
MNTKMKMTLVAGALALAVAGQANAAILGASTTVGGADLILSVWDTNTNTSYTRDLGVTAASFLASPTTFSLNSVADANWTTFLGGVAATDTTNWNVVGMLNVASYLFTSATAPAAADANAVIKTYNGSDAYMTGASVLAGAATSVIVTGATTSGYAGYQFGSNFGGKSSFSDSSALNLAGTSTMGFFGVAASTARIGSGTITAYTPTFTLSSTGALTAGAAVAAVPEPGEWLLMLSGLALIGFIATRRKNEGSMMFA